MEEENKTNSQPPVNNPSPTQAPVVQPAKKPKPKFKFLILLAIPLILISVLILAYVLWIFFQRINPPNLSNSISPKIDTSDWKTYINNTYNYEFKYPPTATGGSIAYAPWEKDFISVYDHTNGEGFSVNAHLANMRIIDLDLRQFLGVITYNNRNWNVFFSSAPCYMDCISLDRTNYSLDFVTKRNNYIYDIGFSSNPNKSISSFQKTVLSNFKFTGKNSTTGISGPVSIWANWKTYNGAGFSILCPNSWTIKNFQGTLQLYDPASMQSFTENGGANMQLPAKYVYINSINSTQTIQEYITKTVNYAVYTPGESNIFIVPVGGYPGDMYAAQGEGSRGYIIVLSSSKKIITINIPVSDPNSDPPIGQILSTFKFTK